MTTVHAYSRDNDPRASAPKIIPVELFGSTIEFKPNDKGHFVAEVDEGDALERLLNISEGYCEYGKPPRQKKRYAADPGDAGESDDEGGIDSSPYIKTFEDGNGGETTVDLRTLKRLQLMEIVKDNEIPDVSHSDKNQVVMEKIVAFFKV